MRDRNLVSQNSVLRVAVIGPGLDFTDKESGYDYYPPQTIQPFALMDSLIRLGLAARSIEVTTLDISSTVNDHLTRVRQQSRKGIGCPIQLPRDVRVRWEQAYLRYWDRFGDQIGRAVEPAAVPAGFTKTVTRAVMIQPEFASRVHPVDLNVVTQHLALSDAHLFDLIIATNIFIYYDIFQQSLALVNVQRMLRPGGFLLSNNVLLELPATNIRSVGYQSTTYSDRPADGDTIVWYQRPR
jgi:hypothetical protein